MDAPVEKKESAWQPLTPGGVAAFGGATFGRLLTVQFIAALIAAGVVVWFLQNTWFRSVQEGITRLPRTGEIRSGKLFWGGPETLRLAESRFVSISVDLKHTGEVRSPAHMQFEFGGNDLQVSSLFGYLRVKYPRVWLIAFNRPQLEPWWGAWRPAILALAGVGVICALFCIWAVLAISYSPVVWLVAFYGNRNLSLNQSRRIAGAALMPGALFMSAAVIMYGLGAMDLVQVLAAVAGHFLIGWAYVVASPLALRRDPKLASARTNPFARRPQRRS